jgi:hypothetical protein
MQRWRLSTAVGFSTLPAGKDVLPFAPERRIRERIRPTAHPHVSADFRRGDLGEMEGYFKGTTPGSTGKPSLPAHSARFLSMVTMGSFRT